MPHSARKLSESGFYHVVSKGIVDQIIFESDVDRRYYLKLLLDGQSHAGVVLHAYCIMSNHVHLIPQANGDALAPFMKYVDERYAMYYANKTGRSGGVYKKPFWSEPIGTDEYLLCAVRYVHANPAVAGLCSAFSYEWSSAREYLGRKGIANTNMVLGMCGGPEGFKKFSQDSLYPGEAFPGSRLNEHLTDDEAMRIAKEVLGKDHLSALHTFARPIKKNAVIVLRKAGLKGKQIARVTGLGESFVYRALK